jgi:hypothetical protein
MKRPKWLQKKASRLSLGHARKAKRRILEVETLEERFAPALVAAYAFNEGTGTTVADLSGNGHTATIINAEWTSAGRFGNALSYNGANARVTVGDSALLRLTNAMTIEAWVNPTQVTSAWRPVLKKGSGDYFLFGTSDAGGKPVGGSRVGGSILQAKGAQNLAANVWTHVALTFDGGSMRFYVNGQLVSMTTREGSMQTSANGILIGGDAVSGEFFQGMIDEIRIFNEVRSDDQIRIDMNTPLIAGGDTQGPTKPLNLTAQGVSGGQIDLAWTPSTDNFGVTTYVVERVARGTKAARQNFKVIGVTTEPRYSDRTLTAGAVMLYRVRAMDAAGNPSPVSATATAGTHTTPSSFESGSGIAALYGTYEVSLTGNGTVANPFDTPATVTFTAPSSQSVTVNMFYDGGNTWRARAYVTQAGTWQWSSNSTDPGLNLKSGSFAATDTGLPGLLKMNPSNLKAWQNARNESFVYIGQAAWMLFNQNPEHIADYQAFVNDAADLGINTIGPVALLGAHGTINPTIESLGNGHPWKPQDKTRFDLTKFHVTDSRLEWIFNQHSSMYLQAMFLATDWQYNNSWFGLPLAVRTKTLDYMLARWAAFPNMIWLVSEDIVMSDSSSQAFNRDVGQYIKANSPWNHLLSTLSLNHSFAFTTANDLNWVDYISLQAGNDGATLGADLAQNYASVPRHVQMSEEWYEQDDFWHAELSDTSDIDFFTRWEFWSWSLVGGSANYAARWTHIHPYTQSGTIPYIHPVSGTNFSGRALRGLDSMPYFGSYLADRGIDLSQFEAQNSLVVSWSKASGLNWFPNLARRDDSEFLVYSPNAIQEGYFAHLDANRTASFTVNLSSVSGTFDVEWYRPKDGLAQSGGTVSGGGNRLFTAPWQGVDVVLRLVLQSGSGQAMSAAPPPTGVGSNPNDDRFLQTVRQMFASESDDGIWSRFGFGYRRPSQADWLTPPAPSVQRTTLRDAQRQMPDSYDTAAAPAPVLGPTQVGDIPFHLASDLDSRLAQVN